jgi:anaerobic ribonucleoside-triphosphate reductase activating protein
MRYSSIRSMDISNGEGVGVSIFVQGCHFHCKNCFNQSTWDFNGGKEWTEDKENIFFELIDRPYIKRVSILGGEPLADENVNCILRICNKIRLCYGNKKTIWLYTGYTWEDIINNQFEDLGNGYSRWSERALIMSKCDAMVDGRYVDNLKDMSYPYAGSTNQRVIDVQKSLKEYKAILWKSGV